MNALQEAEYLKTLQKGIGESMTRIDEWLQRIGSTRFDMQSASGVSTTEWVTDCLSVSQ
jgi:hypothetical protein